MSLLGLSSIHLKQEFHALKRRESAFLFQFFGQVINKTTSIAYWFLFFSIFKTLKGLSSNDLFLLISILSVSTGLTSFFAPNLLAIPDFKKRRYFDVFLLMPKPVLSHVLCSKISWAHLGEIFFGILLFIFFSRPTWLQYFEFSILCLFVSWIHGAFLLLIGSISLHLKSGNKIFQNLLTAYSQFSAYPRSIFEVRIQFLFSYLIPSFIVGSVPMDFLRNHNSVNLLEMLGMGTIVTAAALISFKSGMKKYIQLSL